MGNSANMLIFDIYSKRKSLPCQAAEKAYLLKWERCYSATTSKSSSVE